ncbi:hypothetical protein HK405_008780, partial [Cladochytrium tenue]
GWGQIQAPGWILVPQRPPHSDDAAAACSVLDIAMVSLAMEGCSERDVELFPSGFRVCYDVTPQIISAVRDWAVTAVAATRSFPFPAAGSARDQDLPGSSDLLCALAAALKGSVGDSDLARLASYPTVAIAPQPPPLPSYTEGEKLMLCDAIAKRTMAQYMRLAVPGPADYACIIWDPFISRESERHFGVIVLKTVKEGQKIPCVGGTLVPANQVQVGLGSGTNLLDEGEGLGCYLLGPASLINHSCRPNSEV